MGYADLAISELVIHEIVRKDALNGAAAILSDEPSNLHPEQRSYIEDRIRSTLETYARPVIENTEDPGDTPVPALIKSHLVGDATLLDVSRKLVERLQAVQPAVSPGGIFVAAAASLEDKQCMVISKLEHENGVRAHQLTLANGNTTFDVEILRDLLFTKGSRVFKVAVFDNPGQQQEKLSGFVVDRQSAGNHVAQYFMNSFLGCNLSERADLITERFFNRAEAWVNSLTDAKKKARYEVSLLGEMQSNRPTLSIDDFAVAYLELDDRDEFVAKLTGHGIPARQFEKEKSLISSRISRLKVETASGVLILAPPETLDSGVVLLSDNIDETTTVTITDKVVRFTGQGRYRSTGNA